MLSRIAGVSTQLVRGFRLSSSKQSSQSDTRNKQRLFLTYSLQRASAVLHLLNASKAARGLQGGAGEITGDAHGIRNDPNAYTRRAIDPYNRRAVVQRGRRLSGRDADS